MDQSSGYESVAPEFLAHRGDACSVGIGVPEVSKWAQSLPNGAAVLDLGCGPGVPLTNVLIAQGLNVFAVDGAPSLVQAFQRNFPQIPILCEAVQDSTFFDRTFKAVLAWGLIFLLQPNDQCRLIQRFGDVLEPGGHLLFTSPAKSAVWRDVMTGLESRSLGAHEYQKQLSAVGLQVTKEYEDAGQNHYFEVLKP